MASTEVVSIEVDTVVDEDGDLLVLARGAQPERAFLVSSKAFGFVCNPWNAMLKYRDTLGPQGLGHLDLEDDDPLGLDIIFNIAHLRFNEVPVKLTFDQLLALSILTDKYQATLIVRPWIKAWIAELECLESQPSHHKFLCIAWEFGLLKQFGKIAEQLVINAKINKTGVFVDEDDYLETVPMPPGIVGRSMLRTAIA